MENASKALIIAGAILLSILIISLGIIIYNQASSVVDSGSMDEVAVTTFNEKFRQYEGNNVRGNNVNSMINAVIQNNLQHTDDASKQITIKLSSSPSWNGTCDSTSAQTSADKVGKAQTGKSYKVVCTSDAKSGYVTTITVSPAE